MRPFFAPWTIPGEKPLIKLDGVSRKYGGVVAVDQLSLNIYEREFFALLGPSGCGKTTLLRMIAGFEFPDSGTLQIAGEDVVAVPPYRRPVNMMFQNYALFPHLSVASNIAFGLRQESLSRREIYARVEDMLALVKLEGLAKRKPHQLSGGQRQRVALARSLAKRPKVLLLDEPMAALDRKLRLETQFELAALQEKLGTTFVIVTHDQDEAMTLAHRIAVMDRGRILQVAPPAEIYEHPSSCWVANFVGESNLFSGTVQAVDGGCLTVADASGEIIKAPSSADAWPGMRVWVAVRPEKIKIAAEKSLANDENCLAGQVGETAYLGDTIIFRIKLASGAELKVSIPNQWRKPESMPDKGDYIWVSWPVDAGVTLVH